MDSLQLAKFASAAVLLGVLAGCGGGGGGTSDGPPPPPPPPPPPFTVGGTVTGLVGSVVLQNNGGGDLTISSNGTFRFTSSLNPGAAYAVTVFTPPGLQNCFVSNGSGTGSANVTNVEIACSDVAPPTLKLTFAKTKLFRFAWNNVSSIDHYRLFEDADGSSGFTQVGADIPASATALEQVTELHSRFNARYKLQACGESRCFDSNIESVTGSLADAIGYFKASNPHPSGEFGSSLAMSADGKTMAVGARGERGGSSGNNKDQSDAGIELAGAVYVFVRDGNEWVQQAYVKGSNTRAEVGVDGDVFGASVALSADGSVLAVGASHEDSSAFGVNGDEENDNAPNSGAVYVFTRQDTVWSQQAYIKAHSRGNIGGSPDRFGTAVALSGNGRILAVGMPGDDNNAVGVNPPGDVNDQTPDAGAVYVFVRPDNLWSQQAYVKASNNDGGDGFGFRLALSTDGSTLAVGASGERSDGTSESNDDFDRAGAVYVFGRAGTTWSQQGYLKASNPEAGDEFGVAVALSEDGSTLAVGAHNENGGGGALGEDDDSAPASGAVYVFARASNNEWGPREAYLKASNPGRDDQFGEALALSADGQTLVVGAHREASRARGIGGDETDDGGFIDGAAYVFRRAGAAWSQQAYLKGSNARSRRFGSSVAISSNASVVAVGSPAEDGDSSGINGDETRGPLPNAGAVYLY